MPKATAAELDALSQEPRSPGEASLAQPFGKDSKGNPVFKEEPAAVSEEAQEEVPEKKTSVRTDVSKGQAEEFPALLGALAAAAALCGTGFAYDHRTGAQAQLVDATGLVRLIQYFPDRDDKRWFVRVPETISLLVVPAPEG